MNALDPKRIKGLQTVRWRRFVAANDNRAPGRSGRALAFWTLIGLALALSALFFNGAFQ